MSQFDSQHVPVPELIAGGQSLLVVSTLAGDGLVGGIYLVGSGVCLVVWAVLGAVRSFRNHRPGRPFAVASGVVVAVFGALVLVPHHTVAAALIAGVMALHGVAYYACSVRSGTRVRTG